MEENESRFLRNAPTTVRTQSTLPEAAEKIMVSPLAAVSAPPIPDAEPSLSDVLRLVRERWQPIAMTCALFFGIAVLYCLLATKMYTARAGIEIRGYAPVIAGADSETAYGKFTEKREYLQTQIQKLRRLSIADRVVARDTLSEDLKAYFESQQGFVSKLKGLFSSDSEETVEVEADHHYQHPLGFLQRYLSLIDVRPIEDTSLVELSVTTADPSLSQRIANMHAEAFIDHIRMDRQNQTLTDLKFLQSQNEELKDKVAAAEEKLAEYAENNELLSLSKDQNMVTKEISDLTALLAEATARRIRSESLLAGVKNGGQSSTALDDQSIRLLRVSLKEAEAEYADLNQKVTPAHPSMVQLGAKIASLRSTINEQRKEAENGLRAQFESDTEAEKKLMEKIDALKARAHETNKRLVQYNILEREYDSLKDLHQTIIRQLKEAQISSASGASNISISDFAALPQVPSAPLRSLILLFSLFAGAVVGTAIALVLHLIDNTLKTPDDISQDLGLPSLGLVPSFSVDEREDSPAKAENKASEPADGRKRLVYNEPPAATPETSATGETNRNGITAIEPVRPGQIQNGALSTSLQDCIALNPRTIVSESFRTIRASLLLSSADRPPRVIMTTSAKKGEGKTTFSTNLAITLAQAANRTLVIDADVRQSKVHERFGIPASQAGLVDYLAGQSALGDVISETQIENLYVLTAGSAAPNPAELVGSEKMAQLIELLGLRYDYIIVDSPPILPVADSLMLSQIVDGVVLVVRSGTTERQLAQEATRRLRRVNANVLGAVMNDVDISRSSFKSYGDAYSSEFYLMPRDEMRGNQAYS